MNLVPFRQRNPLARVQDEMNSLFDRFLDWGFDGGGEAAWLPAIDIRESDDAVTVEADLDK